jgi:bifunctional DNase/RNase
MIEVRVGSIERHPVTGAPLIALEPRDPTTRARLVLPLSAAVACSLRHELEGQVTLRGRAYTLLGQVADVLGGAIAAVEIVPASNGMASGRLCIDGREGMTLLPVEIALGIGLSVVLGLPLRVADQLVHEAPRLDQSPSPALDGTSAAPPLANVPPSEVPDAFRRAFP